MSATRDPNNYHQVMSEHVSHDIEITAYHNHTFMWCHTCIPRDRDALGFLFFKTYEIQKPVAFVLRPKRREDECDTCGLKMETIYTNVKKEDWSYWCISCKKNIQKSDI